MFKRCRTPNQGPCMSKTAPCCAWGSAAAAGTTPHSPPKHGTTSQHRRAHLLCGFVGKLDDAAVVGHHYGIAGVIHHLVQGAVSGDALQRTLLPLDAAGRQAGVRDCGQTGVRAGGVPGRWAVGPNGSQAALGQTLCASQTHCAAMQLCSPHPRALDHLPGLLLQPLRLPIVALGSPGVAPHVLRGRAGRAGGR